MKLTLTGKILLCAALNVALLTGAIALLVRLQLDAGLESILLARTHGRLTQLGNDLARRMLAGPSDGKHRLVAEAEARTPVRLGVYLNNGAYVAGSLETLPAPVMADVTAEMRQRRSSGAPPLPPPEKGPDIRKGGRPGRPHPVFLVRTPAGYWFGVRIPVGSMEDERPNVGTLVVFSRTLFWNPFLFDAAPWVGGLLAMASITLACWAPLIRYLTVSLVGLRHGAARIAEGRFSEKVALGRGDEIEQLSAELNRVAVQLEGFLHGQKRFLGDIAHELTAPVARTQAAVGVLEQRSTPEAMPYVERVEAEIQQMSALVTELLDFSKMGLHAEPLPLAPEPVGAAAAEAISREAPPEGMVQLTEGAELIVLARPGNLPRALGNLVRNALRYGGQTGPITISARRVAENVEIVVADQGPGLPEDMLDRVFAPFFRLERSRSRQSGGAGLGLAIVKACVESCGGSVCCRNRSPRGLEVRISLRAA